MGGKVRSKTNWEEKTGRKRHQNSHCLLGPPARKVVLCLQTTAAGLPPVPRPPFWPHRPPARRLGGGGMFLNMPNSYPCGSLHLLFPAYTTLFPQMVQGSFYRISLKTITLERPSLTTLAKGSPQSASTTTPSFHSPHISPQVLPLHLLVCLATVSNNILECQLPDG